LQQLGRFADAKAALATAQELIAAHDFVFLRGQDQRLWEELAAVSAPAALTAVVPATLQLRLLGPFEVRQGGLLLDQWPRRKARLLLAALAMRPTGMRADELAALVGWGEANPHNVLRVNAWALRRALEPGLAKGEPSRYLLVQGDRYRLDPQWVEAIDLLTVESALAEAEELWATTPREAAQATERAMALVHGDLLEEGGAFVVFEPQREAFRRRCVAALHRLGAFYRQHADYGRAESALGRAIAIAPCDEATYLAAMRLYRATGRLEQVRRVYWDCRRALKTHLALVPSAEFEAAYRELSGTAR
jgi:DNA-binding SARP family transcriptional activator